MIALARALLMRLRPPALRFVRSVIEDAHTAAMLVVYATLVVGAFAVAGLAVRVFLAAAGFR